ncbi:MAG: hypothetical protein ACLFPF_09230 [Halanaerobiales bacterium]
MYNIASNPVQFQEDEQIYHPEEYAQLHHLWIEIVSGPGQGQRRYITESTVSRTGGAGVLTVDRDWDILPVVGESEYQVKGY